MTVKFINNFFMEAVNNVTAGKEETVVNPLFHAV